MRNVKHAPYWVRALSLLAFVGLTVSLLMLALPARGATTPSPQGIPGTWTLNFDDEFSNTSLSPTWHNGWFNNTKPVDGEESQRYSSGNVWVANGMLHLALGTYGSLVDTDPTQGGKYTFTGSAAMEARVYTPGSGSTIYNWPAWWTDGQSWPGNGEIDVMEGLDGQACYHVHTNAGGPGGCTNLTAGWHTYGAKWDATAKTVAFYYDGKLVGSEPFVQGNAPQYLILDNTSKASGKMVHQTMLVDYVRVWR